MRDAFYGRPITLEPGVRRVLARNPGAFTNSGTQSFIVGTGEVAVIDPGPDLPEHVDALLAATAGERVVAIVCTHTHRDHSPAARALKAATGAEVVGCAPLLIEGGAEAGFDGDYAPDRVLADGESVAGTGWALQAIATPGHTSNHLCFALSDGEGHASGALFSGDHVMGWSTSVVSPPDGDMTDYMASLERLLGRDDRVYYPAHGEQVDTPQRLVRGMLGHRKQREGQILRALAQAPATIATLVTRMYAGLDPRLAPAAARSVLAHLIDLDRRGLVTGEEAGEWRAT